MALTVTEKEHWKERIARRIDKRIEAIFAEEPNLEDRIQREAHKKALESLGLAEMQSELDEIDKQKETLEKCEKQINRAMLSKVRGVPVEDLDDFYCYRHDSEVSSAVSRRQSVFEDELLADSERGQQVLRLRQEKEELTDVVWLSTSPRQLKDLWSKVNDLLGAAPTQLEQDALAIAPIEDQ